MKQIIFILFTVVICALDSVASEQLFPNEEWIEANSQQVSIDPLKVQNLFNLAYEDQATQAVVLIKDGLLIGERYAHGFDKHSIATSWSMAKSFYAALIGISIDRGEIGHLDDKVSQYLEYFKYDLFHEHLTLLSAV